MKKYFDISSSTVPSRARAYFRFRGRDIHVQRDGERSIMKLEKNFKSAIAFIFSQHEKRQNQEDQSKKQNNSSPIPPQDQDEYIPQNMEDREDQNKPSSFWQVSPPLV